MKSLCKILYNILTRNDIQPCIRKYFCGFINIITPVLHSRKVALINFYTDLNCTKYHLSNILSFATSLINTHFKNEIYYIDNLDQVYLYKISAKISVFD